jgi:hypothetical protein
MEGHLAKLSDKKAAEAALTALKGDLDKGDKGFLCQLVELGLDKIVE